MHVHIKVIDLDIKLHLKNIIIDNLFFVVGFRSMHSFFYAHTLQWNNSSFQIILEILYIRFSNEPLIASTIKVN